MMTTQVIIQRSNLQYNHDVQLTLGFTLNTFTTFSCICDILSFSIYLAILAFFSNTVLMLLWLPYSWGNWGNGCGKQLGIEQKM